MRYLADVEVKDLADSELLALYQDGWLPVSIEAGLEMARRIDEGIWTLGG